MKFHRVPESQLLKNRVKYFIKMYIKLNTKLFYFKNQQVKFWINIFKTF